MEAKKEFFGLLTQSLSILLRNPNFIIFTFLTSLPLFCSWCMYEIIFEQTLIQTSKLLKQTISLNEDPRPNWDYDYAAMVELGKWFGKFSQKSLPLGLLYLGFLQFFDWFNTVATVDTASLIYKEEIPINIWNMLSRLTNETRFKGPLITTIYVLLLDSLISFGLLSFAPYIYIMYNTYSVIFMMLFSLLFIALLTKYIEWSAVWNMGIIISVLEEKHGDVALIVSSYLSRGRQLCGFSLMLVFLCWRLALRLACLYAGWETEGVGVKGTMVHIGLVCFANLFKWVVFVGYYYESKKNNLETNV